jgi:hypothetical protein
MLLASERPATMAATHLGMILALLVACGQDDAPNAGGGAGGAHVDANATDVTGDHGGTVDAGSMCNDVVNIAPPFLATYPDAALPAPAGGTILDGTYFSTKVAIYPGGSAEAPDRMHQETFTISHMTPTKIVIESSSRNSGADFHANYAAEIMGTTLVMTRTCPSSDPPPDPFTNGFSATGNDFSIVVASALIVDTATKQ